MKSRGKARHQSRAEAETKRSIRSRAPSASSARVRRIMQGLVGKETQPEKALRSALHRRGLRFRVNHRPLADYRIAADIVFTRCRVCVFVDGCFWHGCPTHFRVPKSNTSWWREKISDNRRRDLEQEAFLRKQGWEVLRYWEHDVKGGGLSEICDEVVKVVKQAGDVARKERL